MLQSDLGKLPGSTHWLVGKFTSPDYLKLSFWSFFLLNEKSFWSLGYTEGFRRFFKKATKVYEVMFFYTNCLAYRYRYGSEFYNWLPVFLKKAQVVSNYRCKSTILYSLPVFFLFLSFCYLVTFYSHVYSDFIHYCVMV